MCDISWSSPSGAQTPGLVYSIGRAQTAAVRETPMSAPRSGALNISRQQMFQCCPILSAPQDTARAQLLALPVSAGQAVPGLDAGFVRAGAGAQPEDVAPTTACAGTAALV